MAFVALAFALLSGCKKEPEAVPGAADTSGLGGDVPADTSTQDVAAHIAAWDFTAGKTVIIRADEAVELTGEWRLIKKGEPEPGKDSPPAGECYIRCKEKSVPEDDEREHVASFEVEVPADGTYHAWARVWWMDGCGNSITFGIQRDGRWASEYQGFEDSTYHEWHWVRLTGNSGVRLSKGPWTLKVKNSEDGACLNAILLTTRGHDKYTPRGPDG